MNAVMEFLDNFVSSTPGGLSEWTAHFDGTRYMVTQGQNPDCGPGTCFIIEAIVSNIPRYLLLLLLLMLLLHRDTALNPNLTDTSDIIDFAFSWEIFRIAFCSQLI
jgi:hypothetical protein